MRTGKWVAGLAIPTTRSFSKSVGQALLGNPTVSEASRALQPQPTPLWMGRGVPARGIVRPFPVVRRAAVSTEQAP